jgi:hypothetical protein
VRVDLMAVVGRDGRGLRPRKPKDRVAAYPTQAACMADVSARAWSIPMAKEKGSKIYEHSSGTAVHRANGTITSFECWPDTVDPSA